MNAPQKSLAGETKAAVVIPIAKPKTATTAVKGRGRLAWLKKRWVSVSAAVCIGLPTLITAIYLGLIASDRYAVEVKFAVRGQETAAMDALGVFGLSSGGSMSGDSYILVDYVRSRGMFEEVSKSVDLRTVYSSGAIDFFSRLDGQQPIERLVEYWGKMTTVNFEPATGIIRVEVSAYDKQDAIKIANAVTGASESLINRLSTESRHDALKAATTEVERAEQRQRMLRTAMRKFREKEQISDPVRRAGAQQELIERSRGELQRIETELQAARAFMKDDAPSIIVLKNQKAALQKQLDTLQKEVGGDTRPGDPAGNAAAKSVASMLSSFEELEAERVFAEKSYLTALASLERARFEADRKQRFLAIFDKADLPEEARYPLRIRGILIVAIGTALLWLLGVLVALGIREHT